MPPIVSCSPPPMVPMSPPPLTDDYEGNSPDIVGFGSNGLTHDEISIGPPDLNCEEIEDLDFNSFGGLNNDDYDVTGMESNSLNEGYILEGCYRKLPIEHPNYILKYLLKHRTVGKTSFHSFGSHPCVASQW